jgi:CheY-like chemotaxis protein
MPAVVTNDPKVVPFPTSTPTAPKPAPQAAPALQPVPGKPKAKVLVVEDETDARTIFADLLSADDYYVVTAVDGNDALLKAAAEKFDLILLDIMMPNKDGIATLQDIKADPQKYGTPIIVMLSNISGDAAVEKAKELGAAGYKLKIGTEPQDLLDDVAAYLSGRVDTEVTGTVAGTDVLHGAVQARDRERPEIQKLAAAAQLGLQQQQEEKQEEKKAA